MSEKDFKYCPYCGDKLPVDKPKHDCGDDCNCKKNENTTTEKKILKG